MITNKASTLLIVLGLVAIGVISRFLVHIPNATPITAIAMVASLFLGRRWALIIPLLILAISDSVIGMYDLRIMTSVYGSFALIGLTSWLVWKYRNVVSLFVVTFLAPLIFFLVTNLAVWYYSPWYEKNLAGLMYSYELGIPFYKNMLMGDLLYGGVVIGAVAVAKYRNIKKHLPPKGIGGDVHPV